MPKEYRIREPFDKQHGQSAQALLKSVSYHLYHIHWSLPSQLSWKKSLLLTWQMQLSKKQKTFSQFFTAFSKSRSDFEHFEKEYDPHVFCNFENADSKNVVR